jgi:hypothetical protein
MDSFLVQVPICAPPLDTHAIEKARIDMSTVEAIAGYSPLCVIGAAGTRLKKIEKCLMQEDVANMVVACGLTDRLVWLAASGVVTHFQRSI